jgi:hypothetical protein
MCYLVAVVVVLLVGSCAGGAGLGVLARLGRADVAGVPGGPDTNQVDDVEEVLQEGGVDAASGLEGGRVGSRVLHGLGVRAGRQPERRRPAVARRRHGALGLVVQHLPHEDDVLVYDVLLIGRGFALGRKK